MTLGLSWSTGALAHSRIDIDRGASNRLAIDLEVLSMKKAIATCGAPGQSAGGALPLTAKK